MIKRLPLFFFLLLFPFLFFYSSAVGARLIPPVLGGGFGAFTAVALAALLPLVLTNAVKLRGAGLVLTLLFLTLVIYCTVWLAMHHLFGDATQGRSDVLLQWLTLIAVWLALFSIGYSWPPVLSNRYVYILLICMVGISAAVLLNVDFRRLIFLYGLSDAEGSLTYQGLARSAAMTGLVLLAVIRNIRLAVAVAFLLLITLFLIGARSELVGVVAVFPFIAYLHFRERPLLTVMAALVASLIVIGSVAYYYDSISTSRQFQLLNISESTSGMARSDLLVKAFETIKESPLLGDFAGHARNSDKVGAYAHNIFSVWRQLGVVGFFLYLSLLFSSFVVSLKQVRKNQYNHTDLPRIAGTLSLFFLILMLGAKSVFWGFPAFAWGLAVACYRYKAVATPRAAIPPLPARTKRFH
ncbi:MAG: O-antigen ligase family protein [Pseudomonadota bacterium]